MFGGAGGGQPLIVGAHVRLQRGAARGKGGFERMDAFLLRSIQGETLVEKAVNLALDRRCRSEPQARDQHGGERRDKGNQRDRQIATPVHRPSSREGA